MTVNVFVLCLCHFKSLIFWHYDAICESVTDEARVEVSRTALSSFADKVVGFKCYGYIIGAFILGISWKCVSGVQFEVRQTGYKDLRTEDIIGPFPLDVSNSHGAHLSTLSCISTGNKLIWTVGPMRDETMYKVKVYFFDSGLGNESSTFHPAGAVSSRCTVIQTIQSIY